MKARNPGGEGVFQHLRRARFCVEAYVGAHDFKTPAEWLKALDEALSDLARGYGHEPTATIVGAVEEMSA